MVFPSSLDLASTSVKFDHPREAGNGPEDCLLPLRCPYFKEKAGFSPLLHPRPVSLSSLPNKHMWPPPLDPFSHPMTLLQRKKEKRGKGGEGRRAPRSDVMEKKSSRICDLGHQPRRGCIPNHSTASIMHYPNQVFACTVCEPFSY
jgi:hypothetical protein